MFVILIKASFSLGSQIEFREGGEDSKCVAPCIYLILEKTKNRYSLSFSFAENKDYESPLGPRSIIFKFNHVKSIIWHRYYARISSFRGVETTFERAIICNFLVSQVCMVSDGMQDVEGFRMKDWSLVNNRLLAYCIDKKRVSQMNFEIHRSTFFGLTEIKVEAWFQFGLEGKDRFSALAWLLNLLI